MTSHLQRSCLLDGRFCHFVYFVNYCVFYLLLKNSLNFNPTILIFWLLVAYIIYSYFQHKPTLIPLFMFFRCFLTRSVYVCLNPFISKTYNLVMLIFLKTPRFVIHQSHSILEIIFKWFSSSKFIHLKWPTQYAFMLSQSDFSCQHPP